MTFIRAFKWSLAVAGVVLLVIYANWKVSVGVCLLMWANNVSLLNRGDHEST